MLYLTDFSAFHGFNEILLILLQKIYILRYDTTSIT